jgi:triacylglycerol esterase/lipase EstA (alpha/beta hydrolase family)
MQDIEPYFGWERYYNSAQDPLSPFYGAEYNTQEYTQAIYGYYIHPYWDYIGSETLYIKVLFADYDKKYVIIETFGEWNDTLHNDVMHLKRNVIDHFVQQGIHKFLLIGENTLNFHGSDDCYYEEWFEDVEDGWIAALNYREHILTEWRKYNLDSYINYGGMEEIDNWRTMKPAALFGMVDQLITRRIS